ncbi:DUF3769 domain-containing protein, partial [uncultured Prochlorococcus sp.]|uniref:DUF3769 domain-containing protein n=1 Tax=uncultured Prochlorococcus sp. TaxID=159733 RepID=UPI002583AF71
NGAVLLSDYIEYDKNTKFFKSKGNIKFLNGNQIFTSDYFEYNFSDNSGFIENIYGVIDLETFSEDTNLRKDNISDSKNPLDGLENTRLEKRNPIGLSFKIKKTNSNILNFKNFDFSKKSIKKWRFKSQKIKINDSLISSKKIIFTNDAFNPPQLKLVAHNVYSKNKKNKIIFISRSTNLILDQKVYLPLGRREISDKQENLNKVNFGIDNEDKDGLFLSRTSDIFKFKNLDFQLIPELYLKRIFKGETYSFREKGASITGPKIKNQITPLDYFGGKILINGEIASYKINASNSINSLDINKLNESIRSSISLSKNLRNKKLKNLELNYFASYREKIDTGYHGTHEIYNGYGINLKNSFTKAHKKSNWSSNQNLSLGKFKAENHQGNIAIHTRTSFGGNIRNEYTIWKSMEKEMFIDKSYKFVPNILKNELNLVSDLNLAINNYSDYGSQNLIRFTFGPDLTIGSFRKNFFDYTSLKTFLEITSKRGSSPFKFDNINDDLKLNLNFNQQIIKSLSFGISSYLNLNKDSDKFNKFINTKYSLNWNRRAYNFQVYFEQDTKNAGLNFTIFGQSFKGLGKEF